MLALMGAAIGLAPMLAVSADIMNGWSASAYITKIHSLGDRTLFRLSIGSETCGHPDFWSLSLDESARSKLSILLAAYASGKNVALRCENGAVSDFEVAD
jgi:hypothetical protein